MKQAHAVGLAIVGAVIAFFVFAPKFLTSVSIEKSWRESMPELAALSDRLDAQQDSLRALISVRTRLVAHEAAQRLPRSSAMFAFSSDARTPAETREAVARRIREDVASLGDSLRYPIRMHVMTDSLAKSYFEAVAVLPRNASEPCTMIVVLSKLAKGEMPLETRDGLIGPCGFYAAFGAPGPGMTQWLLETRGIHAVTYAAPPNKFEEKKHRIQAGELIWAPEAAACSAGNDSLCVRAWSGTRWMRNMALRDTMLGAATVGVMLINPFMAKYVPGRNLSDLRVAMTNPRFAELWRSDKDPILAYEEIEGRSIAAFARARIHEEIVPHHPGPLHAGLPMMLGLAFAAGCVAVTIRFTKRRRS